MRGGSLGFTGCFKCGGVGEEATIGVAKGSISGVGGIGLEIMVNDEGELYMKRRMERGVGIEVKVPAMDAVDLDIESSIEGDLTVKGMMGQTVGFDQLEIDESTKQLAETGFMLETLLLGGIPMSPFLSPLLKATSATLNNLGGIQQYFGPAIISKHRGMGLEGGVRAGFNANIGPVKINALEMSKNFVANANWHYYPNSSYSKLENRKNYNHSLARTLTNEIDSGFSLNYANKFDLSSLSWGFEFGLSGASLLNDGTGSEFIIAGYRNSNNEIVKLDFSYSNGADSGLFVSEPFIFNSTRISIDSNYSSFVANNETIFDGIVVHGVPIPFGINMMDEFQEFVNTIKDNVEPEHPLKIYNSEKRGIGYDFGFGKEISAAFIFGGGLKIGMDLTLYEELEYPKNHVELYNGGRNFLINSSEFNQSMEGQKLQEILDELFSGVLPLLKEAWGGYVNLIREFVDSFTDFLIKIKDTASETIGNLKGSVSQAGEFLINTYSPRSNRVVQKAFDTPEVRNIYSSPNVLYSPVGKAAQADTEKLSEAGSEVIIISQVVDLSFITEEESESINELGSSITLELEIKESDLVENEFDLSDMDRVKIYRYDLETNSWIRLDGELDDNTLATDIQKLDSYALGIEINRSNDEIPPEIYDSGFLDETGYESAGEIYAKIKDDRYGSGLNFSQTYMVLNGDTLSYTLQPSQNRIFYKINEEDNLTGNTEDVRIVATDLAGNQTEESFIFELGTTNDDNESPDRFELMDNYPNPFNPQTIIPFNVPEAVDVQIRIFDVLGRYVTTLLDERVQAGYHEVVWDSGIGSGQELSTGVYFYQIKAGDFNQVKKMTYLK